MPTIPRGFEISFDLQDTENGDHLATFTTKLDSIEEVTPVVEKIMAELWHDDFAVSISVIS